MTRTTLAGDTLVTRSTLGGWRLASEALATANVKYVYNRSYL